MRQVATSIVLATLVGACGGSPPTATPNAAATSTRVAEVAQMATMSAGVARVPTGAGLATGTSLPTVLPPTRTAARPPTMTPFPTAKPVVSNGIGLTRLEWEQRHGRPFYTYENYVRTAYEGGQYLVEFYDDRVIGITRRWPPGYAPALADALKEGQLLLPSDVQQTDYYTTNQHNSTKWPAVGVRYHSALLAVTFPFERLAGNPGDCGLAFYMQMNVVTELHVYVGH